MLLYFASKDGIITKSETNKIAEICGSPAFSKIDGQEEIKNFNQYKESIGEHQGYITYLLKRIGKDDNKTLFFYCCQVCFAHMEFDAAEKRGLNILAFLMDLDKRQKLTIEQVAMEMKLTEIDGIFIPA